MLQNQEADFHHLTLSVLLDRHQFIVEKLTDQAPNVESVTSADLNGDGHADIIAGYTGTNDDGGVFWFANDGNEGFSPALSISNIEDEIVHVIAYDITGDGQMDIVASEGSSSTTTGVVWYRNDGSGANWTRFVVDSTGINGVDAVVGEPEYLSNCFDLLDCHS